MEGTISQYNLQKGEQEERGIETHLAQRDGRDNLCRARKGKSGVKTKRDA
jgi:hypothetical protein